MKILLGYIFTYLYLFMILGITYILNKKKIKEILVRKFVHISISFCWVIMYYYFGISYHMLIPPITFIIINYVSYKYDLFKMEGASKSLGTVYYPLSVLIMAIITLLYNNFYYAYGIGLFCMAFGDGFAPLVAGYLRSRKIYNNKTVTGTITVFLMSLVVMIVFNYIFKMEYGVIKILIIGITSALLELIGEKGLDNLYLPLGVSAMVYFLGVI